MRRAALNQAARRALEKWAPAPRVPDRMRLRSAVDTPRGLAARLDRLERAYGKQGAARAIGVSAGTLRAWRRKNGPRPRPDNASRVDQAHEQLLQRQVDTMPGRRAELARLAATGANPRATVLITSELQVDGYYNGQAEQVAKTHPAPPLPDNRQAHRTVNFGGEGMRPFLETYAAGGSLGVLVEEVAQSVISSTTFCNSYFRAPEVELRPLED